LLLLAIGFQVLSGAYGCDLANHPDEPAQFITGLMVFDYLRTSVGSNPLAFAQDYYLHYPKVAFGHWPPLFFCVQALCFFLLGPAKSSALVLVILATSLTAICLYCRLRRHYSIGLSFLAVLCFLALPVVRRHSAIVLADTLATLLVTLAVLSFSDFLLSARFRDVLWFAIWSSLALLTKGNEAALVFLPPVALVATGRFRLFKSWKLWFAAFFVFVVCAPFYWLTLRLATNVTGPGHLPAGYILYNLERLPPLLEGFGFVILAVSALGALSAFRSRLLTADTLEQVVDLRVSVAWVLAVYLFQLVFPIAGAQVQYLLPVVPAILLMFARGLSIIQEGLIRWSRPLRYAVPGLLLLLIFLPQRLRVLNPVHGYGAVADAIPAQKGTVVLVSSGSMGEGAIIVERRLRDPERQMFVLRGSKVLGVSAWNGRSYELRFKTTEDIREYLNRVPVHFIIVDDFGYSREREDPHHELLRRTLESYTDNFVLLGRFPCTMPSGRFDSGILLYENSRARGRLPEESRLAFPRTIGRELRIAPLPALKQDEHQEGQKNAEARS
jgi:hypothetical protein